MIWPKPHKSCPAGLNSPKVVGYFLCRRKKYLESLNLCVFQRVLQVWMAVKFNFCDCSTAQGQVKVNMHDHVRAFLPESRRMSREFAQIEIDFTEYPGRFETGPKFSTFLPLHFCHFCRRNRSSCTGIFVAPPAIFYLWFIRWLAPHAKLHTLVIFSCFKLLRRFPHIYFTILKCTPVAAEFRNRL